MKIPEGESRYNDVILPAMFHMVPAKSCRECGALVMDEDAYINQHDTWHDGVDKALQILAIEIERLSTP